MPLAPELASMGASLGAAVFPTDASSVIDLMAHADADMYRRKALRPQDPTSNV